MIYINTIRKIIGVADRGEGMGGGVDGLHLQLSVRVILQRKNYGFLYAITYGYITRLPSMDAITWGSLMCRSGASECYSAL